MTREEAEIYAKTMTYEDALYNLSQARAIPYRKATFIKVNELIKTLLQEPKYPCDVCMYNPPSSADGKPCTMCPATAKGEWE